MRFVFSYEISSLMLSITLEHRRTKTHGFFALMGGFVRFEGDEGPYTLSPEDIKSHLRKNDVTEKDIQDRSKGDTLSKGFAVLQAGWFVLQCIARHFQGLPITELEIVTLAFAILNFATYGLWWDKPLDVRVPFLVGERPTSDKEVYEDIIECDERGWDMKRTVAYAIKDAIMCIFNLPGAIRNVIELIRKLGHFESWNILKIMGILLFPVIMLLRMGAAYDDDEIKPRSKRVGTFYSGKMKFKGRGHTCAILVATLFSMLFGAVHCTAWSFQFPSHTEQLLWRIASLAITCLPVLLLAIQQSGIRHWHNDIQPGWVAMLLKVVSLISFTGMVTISVLYGLARVVLLVLALMSLRSLPSGAYHTVHWTTFIPHI